MAAKYQKIFKKMLEENNFLFTEFRQIHDAYATNQTELQDSLDEKGTKIMRIIRRYEDSLCSTSENTGFGKFSENLSEKFWELIRTDFPHIDAVRQR